MKKEKSGRKSRKNTKFKVTSGEQIIPKTLKSKAYLLEVSKTHHPSLHEKYELGYGILRLNMQHSNIFEN